MRFALALGIFMFASAAIAEVDVIDEQAGISLNAIADGEGQSISRNITASDSLPYDESVGVNLPGDPVHASASGALYTYSRGTAAGLAVSADGQFAVDAAANDLSESYGIASSGFSVRFHIDRPASYSAIGNLFKQNPGLLGEDDSVVYSRLELVDPQSGTPQTLWQVSANEGDTPVSQSAILEGKSQYILTVQALGWVQAAYGAIHKSNSGTHQLDFNLAEFDAGDADLDGDVDLSDLGALASNYGATVGGTWNRGDFDYDGDVDLADLGSLASNYGSGQTQFARDWHAMNSVPEPVVGLLACGLALECRPRRGQTA